MLDFVFGVVAGVVLSGLGILTLPKLRAIIVQLEAKFKKDIIARVITSPAPTITPTVTATVTTP